MHVSSSVDMFAQIEERKMKPHIDQTTFGSITVEGTVIEHDIIIRCGGQVKKRKKKLSRAVYGTSHILSLAEARQVYEKGARRLIIGTGQFDNVTLSEEAAGYFSRKQCQVDLLPTPRAIVTWNESAGSIIGLFHVTC